MEFGWILPSFDKNPKSSTFGSHGKKVWHGHHVIPLLFDQPSSPGPKTLQKIWGFLTVPYLQLPLVLDFFASQDRATYLFNPELLVFGGVKTGQV